MSWAHADNDEARRGICAVSPRFSSLKSAKEIIVQYHKLCLSAYCRQFLFLRPSKSQNHLPRKQRTKSIEGLDCNALSDNTSHGAAAGGIGYTVQRHPQPFTEPSLINFQRSSSPLMRSSLDQSDHSRPERTETTRPVLSIIVSGSCLEEYRVMKDIEYIAW